LYIKNVMHLSVKSQPLQSAPMNDAPDKSAARKEHEARSQRLNTARVKRQRSKQQLGRGSPAKEWKDQSVNWLRGEAQVKGWCWFKRKWELNVCRPGRKLAPDDIGGEAETQ
jgi:hypothetical protein